MDQGTGESAAPVIGHPGREGNEFAYMRELLRRVRAACGGRGLIGMVWDGETLRLSAARPETGKKMYIATFDSADDFVTSGEGLIEQFSRLSNEHFESAGG